MLNRDSISVSGNVAVKYLSDINIDVAFIVPSGVSSDNGFTCGNYSECEFKRLVIEKARRTVILTDNSKAGQDASLYVCGFQYDRYDYNRQGCTAGNCGRRQGKAEQK